MKTSTVAADNNQSATIACDMTLFIRLMEVAREEIKDDASLHQLVERCSEQFATKGQPLTMDDYDTVMGKSAETSTLKSVLARLKKVA